uniref:Cytochrome P450 n=1 Tax=Leersia perrieri TaxID=77586 RepID=A0A0D9V6V2_9ORYZ
MEFSSSSTPIFLLFSILPLLYFLYLRQDPKKQPRAHGLKSYPVVGTLPHFIKNKDRFLEWSTVVMKQSPTHTMSFKSLGLTGGVITASPANIEHILKSNFTNYPKGELAISMLVDFLGHGIFNSDGEQWHWQRKAASYEFNKRSLRNFVVDTVRFEIVERLLPLLERAERDGQTLDVQDVLERFAFDNICHVAFDEDPACLAEESMASPESAEFMRAFNDAQNALMDRFMSPVKSMWRVKRLFNMEPERRMREVLATIHGYAERIVKDRRERGESGLARRDDFLSRFAAGSEHSDESLRDVVTNFLLAGRDTTSSALTWFFWLVSARTDVEDKIVREIRAVRAASGGTGARTFSFDELRGMHYLHAAITESMRLYPPVAMDTHSCKEDDFLPDGTFVGKGWLVSYCAYAMARVEDIWGTDCEEFRPERWLDENGVFRPESPFKYPIFHAGPRMCLGKEMAYIQMKSIVASVLDRFRLRYAGGDEHPGLVLWVTLRMKGGLPMRVATRDPLRYNKKQTRSNGVLKSYPVVGTLPHFAKKRDRFLEWSTDVMKRSPTHTMTFKALGLTGGVITANAANVEHILKTNFDNYPKGELPVSLLKDLLGHGIFNSDGEQWLWQRKAASYEFNQRSLRNFVVDTVRFEIVERLLPLLERARRDDRTLDMQDVLERFGFDNICHVVFDEDPACLAEDSMVPSHSTEFMRACSDAQIVVTDRFMSPVKSLWRVKRLFNLEPERRMREALVTIHGYTDRIIRERRARGEAGLARSDDFLSRFAAGSEHSDESLRDVVTNFLLAGRDTTSSALTWFFWLVSGRPDVEDKIVQEIRAVRSVSTGGGGATFSFDELRGMHYLHAAITESMRLYPPVHMDTHSCKEEEFLPDGTFVGKGWLVTYCAYAMGRVEDIWGADCEVFRPERWLDEAGAFRSESPFKYPVFHAGPRMCLGKEMAYIQMKSIVACVLERFCLRYAGGKEHPGFVLWSTLRMEGGLPMQVTTRSKYRPTIS